jgi:TM2 domain-containing membrane protein YozV
MKNKNTYALLALFLGGFGAHKFYVGQLGQGIIYLIFAPITVFIGFLSGVKWFLSSDEGFDQRFNKSRIQREILKNLSK